MTPFLPRELSIFLLLVFLNTVPQVISMEGPKYIRCYTGENALFRWNTTGQRGILYASLGIRVGDIAYPQFISVKGYNNTVNINTKLKESLRKRVKFVGDLKKGQAWFELSSLTVNDTNEYVVSISDDGAKVRPYFVRLNITEKRKVISIEGPKYIRCYTEENALFRWNTTDQRGILYASWGIRSGDIAYPQFISVRGYNNTVNINTKLEENLQERVKFVGDLKKGQAWFELSSLTVNDTNEYVVSISDDGAKVRPYFVRLNITEKKKGKLTTGYNKTSNGPDRTKTPTTGYNKTSNGPDRTTPDPSTANTALHINDLLMLMAVALVMW